MLSFRNKAEAVEGDQEPPPGALQSRGSPAPGQPLSLDMRGSVSPAGSSCLQSCCLWSPCPTSLRSPKGAGLHSGSLTLLPACQGFLRQEEPGACGQNAQAMDETSLGFCSLQKTVRGGAQQLLWLPGGQQKRVDISRARAMMKVSTHRMTPG